MNGIRLHRGNDAPALSGEEYFDQAADDLWERMGYGHRSIILRQYGILPGEDLQAILARLENKTKETPRPLIQLDIDEELLGLHADLRTGEIYKEGQLIAFYQVLLDRIMTQLERTGVWQMQAVQTLQNLIKEKFEAVFDPSLSGDERFMRTSMAQPVSLLNPQHNFAANLKTLLQHIEQQTGILPYLLTRVSFLPVYARDSVEVLPEDTSQTSMMTPETEQLVVQIGMATHFLYGLACGAMHEIPHGTIFPGWIVDILQSGEKQQYWNRYGTSEEVLRYELFDQANKIHNI